MNIDIARIEYKFHLTPEVFSTILPEIESRLGADKVVKSVHYPIVSEYWDSPYRDIYWERLRGMSERRKFRIRIYGTEDGSIPPAAFLEVKHKSDGRGVKRRLSWNVDGLKDVQANLIAQLTHDIDSVPPLDRRIRQEILTLVERRELAPSCQLRYERMAYEGGNPEEEFRVTFDSAICCRVEPKVLRPDCRDFPLRVIPDGVRVMEVKAHRTMPYWMRDLIGRNHLVPRGFSKYGTAMEMYDPGLRRMNHSREPRHALQNQ